MYYPGHDERSRTRPGYFTSLPLYTSESTPSHAQDFSEQSRGTDHINQNENMLLTHNNRGNHPAAFCALAPGWDPGCSLTFLPTNKLLGSVT